MEEFVSIPEGIEFSIIGQQIVARGPEGEITRVFPSGILNITKEDTNVKLATQIENAKTKAIIKTFTKHITNMLKGVQNPFIYKLKAASVHFPMNLSVTGNIFKISNFLGSKKPILVNVPQQAKIEIKGMDITITSPNIEVAGMAATRLEQATRLSNKDRRIFQDGIFITVKAGKEVK